MDWVWLDFDVLQVFSFQQCLAVKLFGELEKDE